MRALTAPAVVVLLFLGPAAAPTGAQAPGSAVTLLVEGPRERRGLDFLGPNIIPYAYGRYRDQAQERDVEVYFVDRDLAPFANSQSDDCAGYALELPAVAGEDLRLYRSIEGWNLLFRFPVPYAEPCRFVEDFLDLFIFFLDALGDSEEVPFPAALELDR